MSLDRICCDRDCIRPATLCYGRDLKSFVGLVFCGEKCAKSWWKHIQGNNDNLLEWRDIVAIYTGIGDWDFDGEVPYSSSGDFVVMPVVHHAETAQRGVVKISTSDVSLRYENDVIEMLYRKARRFSGEDRPPRGFYRILEPLNRRTIDNFTLWFIVMQRLGHSLAALANATPSGEFKGWPLDIVNNIAIQLIDRLQLLHQEDDNSPQFRLGITHNDLKPTNIVLGETPETQNDLYLIDYDIAQKISTFLPRLTASQWISDTPVEKQGTKKWIGTGAMFRRTALMLVLDDLNAAGQVLIWCATGTLPWNHLSEYDDIAYAKKQWSSKPWGERDLTDQLPNALGKFFLNIEENERLAMFDLVQRQLPPLPNYSQLKEYFQEDSAGVSPTLNPILKPATRRRAWGFF